MTDLQKGSIQKDRKEPVIENIARLIDRYPSRSAAARAWGVNVNTLNSYFKNRETSPTPRRSQLLKIAEVEGVTIDWLLHENTNNTNNNNNTMLPAPETSAMVKPYTQETDSQEAEADRKLSALLAFLSSSEKNRLVEMLARKGVETALLILDEDMVKIAQARPTVKKAALMLNDLPDARVREILAEIEGTERAQVDTLNKKAG